MGYPSAQKKTEEEEDPRIHDLPIFCADLFPSYLGIYGVWRSKGRLPPLRYIHIDANTTGERRRRRRNYVGHIQEWLYMKRGKDGTSDPDIKNVGPPPPLLSLRRSGKTWMSLLGKDNVLISPRLLGRRRECKRLSIEGTNVSDRAFSSSDPNDGLLLFSPGSSILSFLRSVAFLFSVIDPGGKGRGGIVDRGPSSLLIVLLIFVPVKRRSPLLPFPLMPCALLSRYTHSQVDPLRLEGPL